MVKDEWELEPTSIKLGVELGQGAFGRVLIGYCNEERVAIKVLKGMHTTPILSNTVNR